VCVKSLLGDDAISDVPVLILANKIDKYAAAGEEEIRHFFNLHSLTTGKVHSSRALSSTLLCSVLFKPSYIILV